MEAALSSAPGCCWCGCDAWSDCSHVSILRDQPQDELNLGNELINPMVFKYRTLSKQHNAFVLF